MHPETLKELTKELNTDSLVRKLGNKKAFRDFLAKPKQGVHIAIQGNHLGDLHHNVGPKASSDAIKATGQAVSEAIKEAAGKSKAFRTGADTFHAFVPTHEEAASFARNLRAKLEAIPALNGHQLSTSIGFGPTSDHATYGLIEAQKARALSGLPAGQAKNHVHSMVPGYEGPIPVVDEPINLK
jgi:predicted signal transduction protein with EAL and GGDEF domain